MSKPTDLPDLYQALHSETASHPVPVQTSDSSELVQTKCRLALNSDSSTKTEIAMHSKFSEVAHQNRYLQFRSSRRCRRSDSSCWTKRLPGLGIARFNFRV